MFETNQASRGTETARSFSRARTPVIPASVILMTVIFMTVIFMTVILTTVVPVSLAAQDDTPERAGGIVAIVGDLLITQTELDRRVRYGQVQASADYPQPLLEWHRLRQQHAVLDRLIDEKLILHRVQILEKKEGTPYISDAHIDQELAQRVTRLKEEGNVAHSVEDIYRAYRENYGMSRKETRDFLRAQMSIEKYLWREIYPKRVNPWVSPEESRYYYRANIDKFTTPVDIAFRQVFIPRTRRDAQAAVEGMEQGLREGIDFVELARLYSQEVLEGMADQAGRVRTYSFEELASWHDPLPRELQKMKRGEVSSVIISPIGFHFFKVEDVTSGAPEPFKQAHPKIQQLLRLERNRVARRKFLKEERENTRVVVFLPPLPEKAERPSAVEGGLGQEIPSAETEKEKKR